MTQTFKAQPHPHLPLYKPFSLQLDPKNPKTDTPELSKSAKKISKNTSPQHIKNLQKIHKIKPKPPKPPSPNHFQHSPRDYLSLSQTIPILFPKTYKNKLISVPRKSHYIPIIFPYQSQLGLKITKRFISVPVLFPEKWDYLSGTGTKST
jgi:hypothetical protein